MKSQRIAVLLLMLFLLAGCTGETNPMPQSGTPETLTAPVQEIPATDPTWSTVPETQPPARNAPSESPGDASGFVLVTDVIPEAILEIRYCTNYNFVGERIDGYEEPAALLTREAAQALKAASDELLDMGYRIKIFDAYRPQAAVDHFVRWAQDPEDTRMKAYFYPDVPKDQLFARGYIASKSGHSRGSTVDLTLFDIAADAEVDMGGPFDFFGELSHGDYEGLTPEQWENRQLLKAVMEKHGFRSLATEWWHFTLNEEPYPDMYFTFPVCQDAVIREEN